MDELSVRARVAIETVLAAIGVLSCVLYWVHGGDVFVPSYIMFWMGTTAGLLGVLLRFARRGDPTSNWIAWIVLAVLPLVFGVVAVTSGYTDGVWLIAAAGVVAVVVAEASRFRRRGHPRS